MAPPRPSIEKPHYLGHRDRLRRRLLDSGPEALPEIVGRPVIGSWQKLLDCCIAISGFAESEEFRLHSREAQ